MAGRGIRCRAGGLGLTFFCWAWSATAPADEPRLNQVQVIGSHNSYHIAPHQALLELSVIVGKLDGADAFVGGGNQHASQW